MRALFAACLILAGSTVLGAAAQSDTDARTAAIAKTLTCLHCDGRSIDEVDIPLAKDMRDLVRALVLEGKSDLEIRDYFTDRYGDSVVMPLSNGTPGLSPEEIDSRTEAVSKTLRCVVCQNQSIYDSNAPLAEDMRRLVRKRVEAGDSDEEAREYLRARYGDYVLMSPPFQLNTWLLWATPGLLVVFGGYWFLRRMRAQPENVAPEISDQDRARIAAALADAERET